MRLRLISLLAVLALAGPNANAAATQLAPSFPWCGANLRESTTLSGGQRGRVSATCDRQTGAATIYGEDPSLVTDRTSAARASSYFYTRDEIAAGTRHRRYLVYMHVEEAVIHNLAGGPAGPQIDAVIAALPIDCEAQQACGNPSATMPIVGAALRVDRVTDTDIVLMLDWLPERGEETLPVGGVSLLIMVVGSTPGVSVGPASFAADISAIAVTAETIA